MEEIKYEPVFGPQHLFKSTNAEVIVVGPRGDKTETNLDLMAGNTPDGYVIVAMRRIIPEPKRWTMEDQKAGRLPEVGSIFTYRNETLTCHFIDCNSEIWAHDIDNNIVTPVLRDCRPIETPTEKAQRLEDEFFEQVKLEGMNANTPQKTSSLFELGVRAAYRKYLELQAPKGGE